MKSRIESIIAQFPKHVTVKIKKDPELLAWVMDQTTNLPSDAKLIVRIYHAVNPDINTNHDCGKPKTFYTIKHGYRPFCGKGHSCKCLNAHQEKSGKEHIDVGKLKAGIEKKYGVGNISQVPEIQAKKRKNYKLKTGFDSPFNNPEVIEKIITTLIERYGVDNSLKSPVIRKKIEKTLLEKYGVKNVRELDQVNMKIIQTTLERYGVENVFQSDAVKQKIKASNLEQYGVDHYNKSHFDDELIGKLESKEFMEEFAKGKSYKEMAYILGNVDQTTVARYFENHNLEYSYDYKRSLLEIKMSEYLDTLDIKYLLNNRKIISPKELDIVIPEKKIAIEICELYWHSEIHGKNSEYHKNKLDMANQAGYRLITLWENEWLEKEDLIKEKLKSILGLGDKGIFARKCHIEQIDMKTANKFLNQHHIQGHDSTGKIFIGAYHEDQLISVVSYRRQKTDNYELVRFASDGRNHPGLFSKMLKFFERVYNPKYIQSFADLRWSQGNMYELSGFKLKATQPPTYYYVKGNKVYHKFSFRKAKIKQLHPDADLSKTERQLMEEYNYLRIWDCGKQKWIKEY